MNLGILIRKKRIELGITQKELAQHLGVHMQLVSNMERNLCPFPIKHIFSIIKKLNFDEQWFVENILEIKKQKFLDSIEQYRKLSA